MNELPQWLIDISAVVTAVVTVCAMIATVTPTKSDDKVMAKVLRVINVLGLNVGQAKNADDT